MLEAEKPTPEQIANHYSAAMDSVNLLNAGKPEDMTSEAWEKCVLRNKRHLQFMLTRDFWVAENLEPLRAAAA